MEVLLFMSFLIGGMYCHHSGFEEGIKYGELKTMVKVQSALIQSLSKSEKAQTQSIKRFERFPVLSEGPVDNIKSEE